MSKKIVVVAGGTGGHIFPGIAVADYLKQQGWQVSWIGTPDRMEASVVPKHNIEIDFIDVKVPLIDKFKETLDYNTYLNEYQNFHVYL